jgi:hypothetical protein
VEFAALGCLLVVAGWFAYRWLAALAFRHVLLDGLARRYGWRAELPTVDGRAAFIEQERRRRKKAWAMLRQGRMREGYRTGVFGRSHSGSWHAELSLTGMWRGRQFSAVQFRKYELTSGSEGSRRKVRRRTSLSLVGAFPAADVRVSRFGRVQAPPELFDVVKARRWRFRGFHADGGGLSMELGPRLRRGRLLAALNYLCDAADRLSVSGGGGTRAP